MWRSSTWPIQRKISNPLPRVFAGGAARSQTLAVPGLELGMQPRIELEVVAARPDLINRETLEAAVTLRYRVEVLEYLEVEAVVEAVDVEPCRRIRPP